VLDAAQLSCLQDAEVASRQRFFLIGGTVRDADVLRHARDLWLEAQGAITQFRRQRTSNMAMLTGR
jgi:hypothetical protein